MKEGLPLVKLHCNVFKLECIECLRPVHDLRGVSCLGKVSSVVNTGG